jgi:hypothetical protein
MKKLANHKRWLAIGAFVLFMPVFALAKPHDKHEGCGDDRGRGKDSRPCQSVPDGGSAAGYLLAAAAVSMGAVLVRSQTKPTVS